MDIILSEKNLNWHNFGANTSYASQKIAAQFIFGRNTISFLKTRYLVIDGYYVILYFSRSDYDRFYQETLQILSQNNTFLPFHVVIKVAKKFLGSHCLYLTEMIRSDRKLYIWSVWLDKDGKPSEVQYQKYAEECEFDGTKYKYVLPNQMKFH